VPTVVLDGVGSLLRGFRVVTHARSSCLQHQSFFAGDQDIPA
jgi:hypothetical protein